MISDIDFPEVREVDLKLIELARTLQGKIVTNDFNLNKVAQLRGVEVLNINELANSLKPVVLPGEFMKVFILKEGKEYNQGVAYLDDGTMVVVDNARQDDQPEHRRRRHERAADDGRQDDLRPLHRERLADVVRRDAGRGGAGRRARAAPECRGTRSDSAPSPDCPSPHCPLIPPYHWWRTVFFLIPAIGVYTIVLGTISLLSTLFDRAGDFGHAARGVGVADPGDDRRPRDGAGPRAPRSDAAATSSPRTIRASTTSRSCSRRCRFSCASSPRRRSAGFRSSAGTCSAPAICSSTVRTLAPAS